MRSALISLALIGAGDPTPAPEPEYSELSGQLVIAGEELLDPPADQKPDRVGLFWSGEGAKRVYDSMTVKAVDGDACEEGMKLKEAGGLICSSHSDGSYACSVGILLTSGKTKSIALC